jgi:hypothetical protein
MDELGMDLTGQADWFPPPWNMALAEDGALMAVGEARGGKASSYVGTVPFSMPAGNC